MPIKITSPIVSYETGSKPTAPEATFTLIQRPEILHGTTYKMKPADGPSYYITINSISLNEDVSLPYELFIESKDPTHKEWTTGISRLISAIFRINASFAGIYDVSFIIEELSSVFSPNGYFRHGKFYNSILHHIGTIIRQHLTTIGYIPAPTPSTSPSSSISAGLPCPKCQEHTLALMDGCETCLSCGYSKCG